MTANILPDLIADNFCGGGGASLGISRALDAPIDIAVNHDQASIDMHAMNHPETLHLREDVWQVKPRVVCKGRRVRLAWFSPDCTHHSKAKGGKPREKKIRALCWVAVRWARDVKPSVIMLENVEEFRDYGPLDKGGHPIKARKGELFRRFVRALERLGYRVEHRILVAADYGAPTTRKRLYLIARCDGQKIVWPEPTHAKQPEKYLHTVHLKKWRSAAECIDWSIPCPSIFERERPLAENTLRRIAEGIRRYVVECAEPFIVEYHAPKREGDYRNKPLSDPLPTQTAENRFGLVVPSLVVCNHAGGFRGQSVEEPMPTVCASRDAHGVVAPVLVQTGYGEREGQAARALDIEKPLGTIVASGKHAIAAPVLVGIDNKSSGPGAAWSADDPLRTVTQENRFAMAAATLVGVGGRSGQSPPRHPGAPMNTITAKGDSAIVAAYIAKHYTGVVGQDLRAPLGTVTAVDHHSQVCAFLTKYYGTGCGNDLREPMATVTGKDRMGLVYVYGTPYQIVDIGLRMLQPRELARAQGFPDSYVLTGTKKNQVARIGNSVCPDVAEALVRANFAQASAGRVAA